jgi:hypothetical protein
MPIGKVSGPGSYPGCHWARYPLSVLKNKKTMDREFDKTKLNYIANSLKEKVDRIDYIGDISDLGNEIGIVVGSTFKDMTNEDIVDFINGFKHGVSLTNGTH